MANYSKEELQYIATQVQPYLLELVKAMGLDVDGIEVVEEYEGISSLPAYDNRGGTKKLVRVPLRAFAKPATDAIAEIEELILKAEQTIERSESALENTEAALYEIYEIRDELREALQSAQESITALESRVIEVERSETQRVSNENVRVSNENERDTSEAVRKHNEEVRETNEGVRKTAELSRENAEEARLEAENLRKANEQIRQEQELIRSASEEVRKNAEKERETAKANMISLNEELKTHPPKINDNKNWELWDAVNKVYHDTGITARGKTPIIVDGIWWIWNDDKDDFESTGWAVNSDYILTKEKIEGVLGGSPMVYVEEWKHTHVPFKGGSMVKFNQEIYIALRDTDVPPVSLMLLGDGIIAKVDEHTYATIGSFDAVGNKDDWRKIPLDELRLISREGTLDGVETDIRNLSGDDVYRFEPNLSIDMVKGTIKGKKVDLTLPKKNVTDALGCVPVSPTQLASRIDQLFDEDALDVLQGSDVLAIESNGKKATVTVDMLKSFFNTYDLSRHDIYGNAIKQTTANCYAVKSKGYYSFPLVYGNALKNGEVNTPAFTKVEGEYSMDFVNHLDNVITSPYIEQHEGCQPVSVELSLCDTKDVFGAFRLVGKDDCTYVEFEVINVPKTGANGVVSVIDANGDAIWSWHIWLWEDDLTPVTITNATSVNYDILPVNLASKWDEDSKTHIKNWFYQWGRHIPMLSPSAYNSTTDATNYGKRAFGKVSKAASYGVGLKKPWNVYYNTASPYNWFNDILRTNLWDASCVSYGRSDNNVVKTIYDPSPIGFKIPNGNVFSLFSISNVIGDFIYGWMFKRDSGDNKGLFFPASGCRHYGMTSNLAYVGSTGDVWTSSILNGSNAHMLYFNNQTIDPFSSYMTSNGYSIRPVKE